MRLISTHACSSPGSFQCCAEEGKGHWQVREKQEAVSRLAWENWNSRSSPAQALQTETWTWRESEQGRSMRLTSLIKHPVQLFYCFGVIWCNPNTKLHWALNCVTAIPVSALWKVWTSISKSLRDNPLSIK